MTVRDDGYGGFTVGPSTETDEDVKPDYRSDGYGDDDYAVIRKGKVIGSIVAMHGYDFALQCSQERFGAGTWIIRRRLLQSWEDHA